MRIGISCGDVNGVALEVLLKALHRFQTESKYYSEIEFSIAINYDTLNSYSKVTNAKYKLTDKYFAYKGTPVKIINCDTKVDVKPGKLSKNAGKLAAESIRMMTEMTIKGDFDALLTLPISKEVIYTSGWEFPGHTEYLAHQCNMTDPLMILCTKELRIALATIHIPLKDVASNLNMDNLMSYANKLNHSLKQDFAVKSPRIAVLSLNPHAGENGNIGKEEIDIIIPAINNLNKSGVKAIGPFSADGFFAHGEYLRYDAILAMYHDQGLIPIKLLSIGGGINYTAGLPIIRTSPDHGTAFDIAGRNIASEASTYNAIELAHIIHCNRLKCKKLKAQKNTPS